MYSYNSYNQQMIHNITKVPFENLLGDLKTDLCSTINMMGRNEATNFDNSTSSYCSIYN